MVAKLIDALTLLHIVVLFAAVRAIASEELAMRCMALFYLTQLRLVLFS